MCGCGATVGQKMASEFGTITEKVVYKVVLTGGKRIYMILVVHLFQGPCAGKTTALSRIRTFFENLGWKVRLFHTKLCMFSLCRFILYLKQQLFY